MHLGDYGETHDENMGGEGKEEEANSEGYVRSVSYPLELLTSPYLSFCSSSKLAAC